MSELCIILIMAVPAETRRRPGNFDNISGNILKGNVLNPYTGDLPFHIPVRGLTSKDSLLPQARDSLKNFSMFPLDSERQRRLGDELVRITEELEKLKKIKNPGKGKLRKIGELELTQESLRQELAMYAKPQTTAPPQEQPPRRQRKTPGLSLETQQSRGLPADPNYGIYLHLKEKLGRTGELKKGRRGKKGDYEIFEELRRIYEEN